MEILVKLVHWQLLVDFNHNPDLFEDRQYLSFRKSLWSGAKWPLPPTAYLSCPYYVSWWGFIPISACQLNLAVVKLVLQREQLALPKRWGSPMDPFFLPWPFPHRPSTALHIRPLTPSPNHHFKKWYREASWRSKIKIKDLYWVEDVIDYCWVLHRWDLILGSLEALDNVASVTGQVSSGAGEAQPSFVLFRITLIALGNENVTWPTPMTNPASVARP